MISAHLLLGFYPTVLIIQYYSYIIKRVITIGKTLNDIGISYNDAKRRVYVKNLAKKSRNVLFPVLFYSVLATSMK